MATKRTSEGLIGREVERMFGEISARRGELCETRLTGGEFVYGSPADSCIVHHGKFARPLPAMGHSRPK